MRVVSTQGRPDALAEVMSDTLTHIDAPLIDGARGKGRWVRELQSASFGTSAISESQIKFI